MRTDTEGDTPVTDAFREVVFAQYKEGELTGDGMGNILAALTDIETLERERDSERALADRLAEAANAVIDQWETPNWKLTEPTATYMHTLRNTLAAWKEARSERR